MNFLGHLYLSGEEPLVIVGNFMADAVKGRDLTRFPAGVQRGIRLHRTIDTATDTHPLYRTGRARVRPHAGRYAGVVMDLFYDHLLAAGWEQLHAEPLPRFAARIYALLNEHTHLLPERTRHMLPWMVRGDWLTSYATLDGIGQALEGLSRRVPQGKVMRGAEQVLRQHLPNYQAEFGTFLNDLRRTAQGA